MSNLFQFIVSGYRVSSRLLDHLQSPFALAARVWVAWQFFKGGLVKISSWDNTLFLFREEYHTPVLSPAVAAVLGTFGEMFFPVLLALGLATRFAALGLSMVNVMAVVAYAHVLLSEGFEAALGQHVLWGVLLLVIVAYGPGQIAADRWLNHPRRTPERPTGTRATLA